VCYFIVAVLWRVGRLDEALSKAVKKLQGEKQFSFSNILLLCNGLLKYRHPDFPNQTHDLIERAREAPSEHPFKIPEKIAAIRTSRLPKPITQGA